jgi:lincosamide nucleotidyltransferase A/C/D/E
LRLRGDVGARQIIMATSAADALAVLDVLDLCGADPRITGGWGIDAIVGQQTREHRDVDLAIRAEALESALNALRQNGFHVSTDWLPVRVELTCAARHVDLHPLHYRSDGSAWQVGLENTTFEYPAEDWVVGHIGGREVKCLSASRQRLFHWGYEHSDVDRHDMALLDSWDQRS